MRHDYPSSANLNLKAILLCIHSFSLTKTHILLVCKHYRVLTYIIVNMLKSSYVPNPVNDTIVFILKTLHYALISLEQGKSENTIRLLPPVGIELGYAVKPFATKA